MDKDKKTQRPTVSELEGELIRLRHKRGRINGIKFVIELSLVAIAVIITVTNLWFPVLRVVGTSMQPLLKSSDVVLCIKEQEDIKRGDIVAFYHNDKILLKRVVGLPGDTIRIDDYGKLYVNGREQSEEYVTVLSFEPCDITFPVDVPENSYFLLGDQRTTSMDSRSSVVGMVSSERLIGKAVARVWPFDEITVLQ